MLEFGHFQKTYNLTPVSVILIEAAPVLLTLAYIIMLNSPLTDRWAEEMLSENRPVELLTFVTLLWAGILGLILAKRSKNEGDGILVYGFYFLFSCAMIFTAMEEISWGQTFFDFSTPLIFRTLNSQGEFSLHNIRGLQGQAEIFRGIYGLGGMFGIGLSSHHVLKKICPPVILLPWFLIILIFSLLDFYVELCSIHTIFSWFVLKLAEVMELLVGLSAVLFVWLNYRKLVTTLGLRQRLP